MSDHDRHVTGNYGADHPSNAPGADQPTEKCERCVNQQEGYCQELNEFLCSECLCIGFQTQIEEAISEHTDDNDAIDKAFENASVRTDADNVFTSVDFDLNNGFDYGSITVEELYKDKQRANEMAEQRALRLAMPEVRYDPTDFGMINANVHFEGETFCGFGKSKKEAVANIIPRARRTIADREDALKNLTEIMEAVK
jgi:hypothetical protein